MTKNPIHKVLILLMIFISYSTFGQKTYEFDYQIEYDFYWDHRTSKPIEYIYLTNSQNNEFSAVLTETDSASFKLDFLDHKGNHSISNLSKDLFESSKTLLIDCNDVKPHSNTRKGLIKKFNFIILNDTLIGGDAYRHYALKSRRNTNSAVEHYIIDTTLESHLPILRYATAYGRWESTKNLPNGIISQRFLMSSKGKKRHKLILKGYAITNKAIIVPEDCDYSE